jgi:plasmid stabilization system protein ParE
MSYHIIVQPAADEELQQAAHWIAQYSPEKATLWYFDALQAIESLRNFPARCPFAPERKTFKMEIRHRLFDKYRILFVIEDETVYVLRVRHQAQQTLQPDDDESRD